MSRPGLVSRPSSVTVQSATIVLVSGGNAGIGLEIVKAISKLPNHRVLMGCRDTSKGETAAANIGAPANVNPMQLDITDDESIEHAYLTIAQMFGKLDILINNAGIGGFDFPKGMHAREAGARIFDTNVISTQILTDKLIPLLEKSKLPKVIFVSSLGGSIQKMLDKPGPPMSGADLAVSPVWYCSSKSALNYQAAWYAKKYPQWKSNAVCPGYRATKINGAELSSETDPALGAIRVLELVREGPDGVTGTFSDKDGLAPW